MTAPMAHFHIKTAAEMHELGEAFSAAVLRPAFACDEAARPSLVLAAYGPSNSGKGTFLFGLSEAWFPDPKPLNFDYGARKEATALNGAHLRHVDMGYESQPGSFSYFTSCGKRPPEADIFRSFDGVENVRPWEGKPGFDMIEHPTLMHLVRADFLILAVRCTCHWNPYEKIYAENFKKVLTLCSGDEDSSQKNVETTLRLIEAQQEMLASVRQDGAPDSDGLPRRDRVLCLAYTGPDETMARRFDAFKRKEGLSFSLGGVR